MTENSHEGGRRRERATRVGGMIVLVMIALASLVAMDRRPAGEAAGDAGRVALRLDLNSATVEELMLLPGIGEGMASRIVMDRELRGPFASVRGVLRVRGVGERTLRDIKPYVRVGVAGDGARE